MRNELAPSDAPSLAAPPGTGSHAGVGPRSASWRIARGVVGLDRPRIMGVLNTTPDSFWEGSRAAGVDEALRRAATMLDEGADLLDVGGESTRPGARPVPPGEEVERVVPVVRALAREWPGTPISVDTVKAAVAERALDAGAAIINDVSGLRLDPRLGSVVAAHGAGVVLMHSRGSVADMARYETAVYGDDAVAEVVDELAGAARRALAVGIAGEAVVLDPGLGFSKRTEESVAVLRQLGRLVELGWPVLVGPSRKRFLGELAGGLPVEARLPGTIAACVAALLAGARIFRVHDVAPIRHALQVAEAVAP